MVFSVVDGRPFSMTEEADSVHYLKGDFFFGASETEIRQEELLLEVSGSELKGDLSTSILY